MDDKRIQNETPPAVPPARGPARSARCRESLGGFDPLAMALFGVVKELPAAEQRGVLRAIDDRLRDVCRARTRLALEMLQRAEQEIEQMVSQRPGERRRTVHPERYVLLGSSTHVTGDPRGSWVPPRDASHVALAVNVEDTTLDRHHPAPEPSDEEVLEEFRRCAREVRVDFSFEEYRVWALAQRAMSPERRGLVTDRVDIIRRFGNFPRACFVAGLGHPAIHRSTRGGQSKYTFDACVNAVQAAAREIGTTGIRSASEYMRWRTTQLEDAQRRGERRLIPGWKVISDRFGTWPRAIAAVGLISPQEAADYCCSPYRRASDAHVARWLCVAATILGPRMTGDAYREWRQQQIDDPKAGYPPSQRLVEQRFGGWATAAQSADAALATPHPFERLMEILRARSRTQCSETVRVIHEILPGVHEGALHELRALVGGSLTLSPAESQEQCLVPTCPARRRLACSDTPQRGA